jgi:UDP-N-acetylenolpyruvoylglucosamine reductase
MSKKAFFIGIKGVGMTALALAMQDAGWEVSGSDTQDVFITDHILAERHLEVRPLSSPIPDDTQLVVYSGAYNASHKAARVLSLAEALAEFVKDREVIAVAGVGGKTTTSAMLATMFKAAGRDVGYYIGTSDIVGLASPGYSGTDPVFVVEADEYAISKTDTRPKFALLTPQVLVTTNIKHDHPDIYPDEAATLSTFRSLVESLPAGATWIANEDDPLTQALLCDPQGLALRAHVIRYGKSHPLFDKLKLSVFGDHNKLDALAAVLAGITAGLSESEALSAIRAYRGAKRRQEKIGEAKGRLLYDDYGHHPHEIAATIISFKEAFPSHRLVLVFESHTYSRTEALLPEFGKAISLADQVYIMPIFESAREKGIPHTVTPESLAAEVAKYNPQVQVLTWDNAATTVAKESQEGDLILTMGAGFVYKLHEQLRSVLKRNSRQPAEKGSSADGRTDLQGINIQQNISLAPHTYFKLGGPADYFVEVKTKQELVEAVTYGREHKLPFFVLGGGSNIIVTDKGYRGLIIKNKTSNIEVLGASGTVGQGELAVGQVIVQADSGVAMNRLISYTIGQGLAGLAVFLGLPGSVGGAIYNNSHHLDDLVGNHVVSVELLTESGEIKTVPGSSMGFAYDYSILHKTHDVVLSATFRLAPGDKEALQEEGKQAVARRGSTQPLGTASSGCIFKNIELADAMRIGTPNHTLSVGYLIDHAGLKGTRVGGAVVSDIHANFIVNEGSATTQDILDLIEVIKAKVKEVYGVTLSPEVVLIGEK